jgi:hypothetical protein
LDLYHENSQQHEKILELNSILESERDNFALAISDGSNVDSSKMKAKKLKSAHSTVNASPLSSLASDDSEMIMQYEKRIAEMLMTIQKQERDILYKDEENRSIKNIARDLAE